MELGLHLHRWERRSADWPAAAVAGFAAGALLMVIELSWAAVAGSDGPWRISRLVAALVLGPDTLQTAPFAYDTGVVIVALATHYLLGMGFGMVLGFVVAGFHLEGSIVATLSLGAAFGALLYVINFHVLTQVFWWFAELRGTTTLVAHLVFGIAAALLYWKLARRGPGLPRAG